MKKTHGITLIALIITIILLLILAGITINFTLGENGILKNAEIAKEKYNNSVKYENEIIDELYNQSNSIITGSNTKTLSSQVSIGDSVAYNPTEGVIDKKKLEYESLKGKGQIHGNGYGIQKFTANNNIKWKVLEIDNSTGEIILISEEPILTDENQYFYLSGAIGYLYAEQELNEICKIYGYGKGANTTKTFTYKTGDLVEGLDDEFITGSGAKSISVEDINKIIRYTPVNGLSDTHTIYYPTKITDTGVSIAPAQRTDIDTAYAYYEADYIDKISSTVCKMIFGNSADYKYWLSSTSIQTNTSSTGANFFV